LSGYSALILIVAVACRDVHQIFVESLPTEKSGGGKKLIISNKAVA
jgi:hypothetical protein